MINSVLFQNIYYLIFEKNYQVLPFCYTLFLGLPIMSTPGKKRMSEEHAWELSKENVVPIRKGRVVSELNQALASVSSEEQQRQLHIKRMYVFSCNKVPV